MSISEKQMKELYEWEESCIEKYGFYIHTTLNGEKDYFTNEVIDDYTDGFCDIHTHGLNRIDHPEIRIVCCYGKDKKYLYTLICSIAENIIEGKYNLNDGKEYVSKLYLTIDGKDYLNGKFIKDPDEENVLRLIRFDVPDEYIKPQYAPLEMLRLSGENIQ